jgi:hypothetical protein
MNALSIDSAKVQDCFDGSFKRRGDYESDNKILREDALMAKQFGIILHPQITINNMTYRGDLDAYDIFRTVCAGF